MINTVIYTLFAQDSHVIEHSSRSRFENDRCMVHMIPMAYLEYDWPIIARNLHMIFTRLAHDFHTNGTLLAYDLNVSTFCTRLAHNSHINPS